MKTRPLISAAAAVLLCAALSASPVSASTAPADVIVAVCPDGTEWMGVAPAQDPVFALLAFTGLEAVISALPQGCEGFLAGSLPGDTVLPDPGDVATQDAAVWSRGTLPVMRASDVP